MATKDKAIVFITGANKGIGYQTIKALLLSAKPYYIYLGTRSVENGNAAVASVQKECPNSPSTIEVIQIDVSSDESINAAFEKVKSGPGYIDVLVNNAGILTDQAVTRGNSSLRDVFNEEYNVNVSGTHVMTHTFAPLLIKSPRGGRLLFLTSGLASLQRMGEANYPSADPIAAGWPKPPGPPMHVGYRSSKTALNMMMLSWYWILREDGVKVWSISPGFLLTDLGDSRDAIKASGASDPFVGGDFIRRVVEGERDADVGKVVSSFGEGLQSF